MKKSFRYLYIVLTVIKLFTAKIGRFTDSTKSLVLKVYPTLFNDFKILGERTEDLIKYENTWYFKKQYIYILIVKYCNIL